MKESSLRSHLNNKGAVPPSPVLPLLFVWVWGLGRDYVVYTGCVGPGFLRGEDRTAKVHESRGGGVHESDCLSANPDSTSRVRSGLGQDI